MAVSESLEEKRVVWRTRSISQFLSRCIATGFGVGYLPLAPGTWGSFAAVVLLILLFSHIVDLVLDHVPLPDQFILDQGGDLVDVRVP